MRKRKTELVYPPYKSGYFPVGDGHKLYYELYGNPKGEPVLYFHGGPGTGFSEKDKRFFDPKIFNVILFDQRGAGRSKPFSSLHENTTQHLVDDARKLLDFLKVKKSILFGGSWGSTLALVFAITHPEMVEGMVLRGIFLATEDEDKHFVGGGVKHFFPEAWERLISHVPRKERKNILAYYLSQMTSKDKGLREKYLYEWARYEISIMKLKAPSEKKIKKILQEFSYKSFALVEAHYIANKCFLEENFILKNTHRIAHIPSVIVHGRYDIICRPSSAYKLHKRLKRSRLHLVTAGHSSSEKAIEKKLIEAMKYFASLPT